MTGQRAHYSANAIRSFPAILDVTRTLSRVGYAAPTGIDRVERAYLEWCLASPVSLVGFARTSSGYAFLDRRGLKNFFEKTLGKKKWGARDLRALVGIKTPKMRAQAESDIRRDAIAFATSRSLSETIKNMGLGDHVYLNVGHSNLSELVFEAFTKNNHSTAVFLHDVIPLEHPEFQKPGSVQKFETKIDIVKRFADVVIVNSYDTKKRSLPYLSGMNQVLVSHLGVETPPQLINTSDAGRPYFVCLGTIEPRKNHKLLLDVWADLKGELGQHDIPTLHIVGQRGWNNAEVFERLDKMEDSDRIVVTSNLEDKALWRLLANAQALLFPSIAEGFGLPSLEAASLGVPVICGDLAIHRELLGQYPVYVDKNDPYLWKKIIIEQTQAVRDSEQKRPHIPSWDAHFARVDRVISQEG